MRQAYQLTFCSEVAAPPETVWTLVSTMAGVNQELAPLLRMTYPPAQRNLPTAVPLGRRAFRSWLLLFGLVPIEYDDLTLLKLAPNRGFVERSPMMTLRIWQHVRTLRPVPGGCRITDRLTFVPRLPYTGWLWQLAVRGTFAWRHRNLRRIFGTGTVSAGSPIRLNLRAGAQRSRSRI